MVEFLSGGSAERVPCINVGLGVTFILMLSAWRNHLEYHLRYVYISSTIR